MKRVHQFKLSAAVTSIDLPRDRQVVLVGHVDGVVTIWIEHDDELRWTLPRRFTLVPTGEPIPEGTDDVVGPTEHVGSTQLPTGEVWHVYEG